MRPFAAYRFIRRVDFDPTKHRKVYENHDPALIERIARTLQKFAVSAEADSNPTDFHDAVAACRTESRNMLVVSGG